MEVQGTLLDSEEKILSALGLDRNKALPPGEDDRVRRHLDALGYRLKLVRKASQVVLQLTPFRVIRKIYIKGNWPIFEDEIIRRLRFRPGQRLPEGKELEQAIERQEVRIKRFLSREGYFDGHLRVRVLPTDVPHQVNIEARILKGHRYKVGQVKVEPVAAAMGTLRPGTLPRGGQQKPPLAVDDEKTSNMFQQKILFYKRAFSTERFKEDAQSLVRRYHALGYPGVRVSERYTVDRGAPPSEAVHIKLKVQQRKKILLRFEGNKNLSDGELREALTLFEEGTYDDYELAQSAHQMRRLYQKKGYLQARVSFSRKVGPDEDRVLFSIIEGPRLRIREVLFTGNRAFTDHQLRQVIRTRTFPWLGYVGLGEGGYITERQLQQDMERLQAHYQDHGFPGAQVKGELAPHPSLLGREGALAAAVGSGAAQHGDLFVRFTIIENQQWIVDKVILSGNKAISRQVLLAQLALKPSRPFTAKALTLDKARLVRIYNEQGFPYVTVRSLEEQDPKNNRVNVQITIQEGQHVRFGPVFIRGNFKTRERVILSDISFKEGDPFDIRQIEAAELLMRGREIFNVVRIQPLGMSDQLAVVPVMVQVEERYDNRGVLEFAVGGSTDNKLFGSVAYRNHNFLGFGTELSLKGEYGWEIWSGNIHYRDPRVLGSKVGLDIAGSVRSEDTERLGEIFTAAGRISLNYPLLPKFSGIINYEIRQVQHKEYLNRPAGVDESWQVDVTPRTGAVGASLIYDRRDSKFNPGEGFKVEASLLAASVYLGGTDHFLKFNVNGQLFIPLPKKMIIALNLEWDYGVPLGGSVMLPKVERYYAGGDTTVRGLEEDMVWVERLMVGASPLGGATLSRVRPQGGNIRMLANLEFQFPIWEQSIIFGFPLRGAVFFDNGAVTNSMENFQWERFRHGLGLALRLVTPVGFTSLEYAWCLDPEPWDPDMGRFHFNFGYIF